MQGIFNCIVILVNSDRSVFSLEFVYLLNIFNLSFFIHKSQKVDPIVISTNPAAEVYTHKRSEVYFFTANTSFNKVLYHTLQLFFNWHYLLHFVYISKSSISSTITHYSFKHTDIIAPMHV